MADEQPKVGVDGVTPDTRARVEASMVLDWPSRFKPMGELGAYNLRREPPPLKALLFNGAGPDDGVYLPRGKVGLLAAAGGVGKTHALVHLALSLATGHPWLGYTPAEAGGPVLLALGEETDDEIQRRLYWAAQAMNLNERAHEQIRNNLYPVSLCGLQASLVDGDGAPTLFLEAMLGQLEQATHDGWTALLLDPASRFMGSEAEKDNAQATQLVAALERLAKVKGEPTVLAAHHTRKSGRTDGLVDINEVRGSSALVDGVRWVATMGIEGEGADERVVLSNVKNNYGRKAALRKLKRGAHGVLEVDGPLPNDDRDDY